MAASTTAASNRLSSASNSVTASAGIQESNAAYRPRVGSEGTVDSQAEGRRKHRPTKGLEVLVRKRGFEPLRYCYRQPLKLVRLPVPPLPRRRPSGISSRQAIEDMAEGPRRTIARAVPPLV